MKKHNKENKITGKLALLIFFAAIITLLLIVYVRKIGPINGKLICEYKNNTNTMINSLKYDMDFKLKNVKNMEIQEVVESDDNELLQAYKQSIEDSSKEKEQLKYYEVDMKQKGNKLYITTKINYKKLDMKKYIEIDGDKSYIKHNKVKVSLLKEIYEKNGAKCSYK